MTCPALAVVRLLDVKPEKERWEGIVRDWYAQGLADTPSTDKLHCHHQENQKALKMSWSVLSIFKEAKKILRKQPYLNSLNAS